MKSQTVVIASYTSWYHLLGIFSYLKGNNITPDKSILVVNSFLSKVKVFDDDILSKYLGDYALCFGYDELDSYVAGFDRGVNIYVLSTSDTPYRLTQSLRNSSRFYKIVVIEEGIGSYAGRLKNILSQYRESGKPCIYGYIFLIQQLFFSAIKFIVFYGKEKSYWYNFDRPGATINSDVVEAYRSVLKEIKLYRRNRSQIESSGDVSILIGAPFCELGLIDECSYANTLGSLLLLYRKVYVKPHPAEDLRKYSNVAFELVGEQVPFELLYGDDMASMDIYSFTSTCLYTSFLFYGKKIKRIEGFDPFYQGLSKAQRAIIDRAV